MISPNIVVEALVAVSHGITSVVRHRQRHQQRQVQMYVTLGVAALTAAAALYPKLHAASTVLNEQLRAPQPPPRRKRQRQLTAQLQSLYLELQQMPPQDPRRAAVIEQQQVVLNALSNVINKA